MPLASSPRKASWTLAEAPGANLDRAPLHVRVREQLRHLALHQFEDGEKFFTEPALIDQLGVSQGTVRRALTDLAREGLLVRKVPHGTFVRKPATDGIDVRVIMPGCDSVFLMGILEHVLITCQQRKLPVRIHHTHQGAHVPETLLQLQGSPSHQRILMLGETQRAAHELYVGLSKHGFRVVNVDTLATGCGDAYVGVDNELGIRLGMEHLTSLGHRRIMLLVSEPREAGNTRSRITAFQTIVREQRLDDCRVADFTSDQWRDDHGAQRLKALLEEGPRPTALFAVSDPGAWAALRFLAELGIDVPAEVSVLGFDDDRASAFMQPALSTLAQPVAAIAGRALDLLTQGDPPASMDLLPPRLVVRESTAPARR